MTTNGATRTRSSCSFRKWPLTTTSRAHFSGGRGDTTACRPAQALRFLPEKKGARDARRLLLAKGRNGKNKRGFGSKPLPRLFLSGKPKGGSARGRPKFAARCKVSSLPGRYGDSPGRPFPEPTHPSAVAQAAVPGGIINRDLHFGKTGKYRIVYPACVSAPRPNALGMPDLFSRSVYPLPQTKLLQPGLSLEAGSPVETPWVCCGAPGCGKTIVRVVSGTRPEWSVIRW